MIIPSKKGLIALDIDGTLTSETKIPVKMIDYLALLEKAGWIFAFITGRPFEWTYRTICTLPFQSIIAIQNGALMIEMPSKKILKRYYLNNTEISKFDTICRKMELDFVIYSGYENDDLCYYRSNFIESTILNYTLSRAETLQEKWREIASFADLPIKQFASFKCFTDEKKARLLSLVIEKDLGLHAPWIRDPINSDYFVVQVTHPLACKGKAIENICDFMSLHGPIIAAGNDYNDLTMLQTANIKIVMADAPQEVLKIADIIAPSAKDVGLIHGLEQALNLIQD